MKTVFECSNKKMQGPLNGISQVNDELSQLADQGNNVDFYILIALHSKPYSVDCRHSSDLSY